jgi:hypothetical protein
LIVFLMDYIRRPNKGRSKRSAATIAGRILCLLAGDWYTDASPEPILTRYARHKGRAD